MRRALLLMAALLRQLLNKIWQPAGSPPTQCLEVLLGQSKNTVTGVASTLCPHLRESRQPKEM